MKKYIVLGIAIIGGVAAFEYARRTGLLDQVTGKVKRVTGELTDDKGLQIEGILESSKGKIKEVTQNVKDHIA